MTARRLLFALPALVLLAAAGGFWAMLSGMQRGSFDPRGVPSALVGRAVPSFALQTLVENAVQHGAAPRVAPTEVAISATRGDAALVISVRNGGDGDGTRADGNGAGTGLARLRERLSVLYGGAATLVTGPIASGGYEAVLTVPRNRPDDA